MPSPHWQAGGLPKQVPASQQAPFAQLCTPEQLTPQEVPEQLTRWLHEGEPLQTTVVALALLEMLPAHERAPPHSTMQVSPLHEMGCAHESCWLHRRSHVDASHSIGPPQVSAPIQATLHLVPLQAIRLPHAPAPMQSMVQELAALQSIVDEHELAPVQLTAHGIPGGQTMGATHVPAAVHAIVQVPAGSHVPTPASAQSAGQSSAASRASAASAASDPMASRPPSMVPPPSSALPSRGLASPSSSAPPYDEPQADANASAPAATQASGASTRRRRPRFIASSYRIGCDVPVRSRPTGHVASRRARGRGPEGNGGADEGRCPE
jgi:hypothetical protein